LIYGRLNTKLDSRSAIVIMLQLTFHSP